MLQRYSVRLWVYSWFMKHCHPKLASAGVIAVFPVLTLVGANNDRFRPTTNFNPNPERIGRIVRRRVVPPQKRLTWPHSFLSTSASSPMAQKTLHQLSAPSSSHISTGMHQDQAGNDGFELKTGLVNMVQASSFCGKASEDANAHLQNFLEVSNTINPRGTTLDDVRNYSG